MKLKWKFRVRWEFNPRDLWIGGYWKYENRKFDLWLILIPTCPWHITVEPTPQARTEALLKLMERWRLEDNGRDEELFELPPCINWAVTLFEMLETISSQGGVLPTCHWERHNVPPAERAWILAEYDNWLRSTPSAPQVTGATWDRDRLVSVFADVMAFHQKFGLVISPRPCVPAEKTVQLRHALIDEEYEEVCKALVAQNLPELADGIVDLVYVLVGAAISYGLPFDAVWRAVQQSNMAKEGGATRVDGKILKPLGWTHPDVAAILREHGWEG